MGLRMAENKNMIWWIIGIVAVIFLISQSNLFKTSTFSLEEPKICPEVCVPMYKISQPVCITSPCPSFMCTYNACGSGCGPDNVNTFATKSECENKIGISDGNRFDFKDIPTLAWIVIGGLVLLFIILRKK